MYLKKPEKKIFSAANFPYLLSVGIKYLIKMAFAILRFSHVELPNRCTLPFLNVQIVRNSTIMATLNQKSTSNTMYINWNAFGLEVWKRSLLKLPIECTYVLCSTKCLSVWWPSGHSA